jgi:hypothetical protein
LPAAPGTREYFDYLTVDADARRVYVTHGTEVDVLNADDYSLLGKIGGLQLSHAVIVLKELGKGIHHRWRGQEGGHFSTPTPSRSPGR